MQYDYPEESRGFEGPDDLGYAIILRRNDAIDVVPEESIPRGCMVLEVTDKKGWLEDKIRYWNSIVHYKRHPDSSYLVYHFYDSDGDRHLYADRPNLAEIHIRDKDGFESVTD